MSATAQERLDSVATFDTDTIANTKTDTIAIVSNDDAPKPSKYIVAEEVDEHLVFFQGFTLSADVFNALLYTVADYGTLEAALRLNLKNTYFPIFELGYGRCTEEDFNTKVKYHTAAPFARIGVDWNVLKNKFQDNRLYVGIRYGVSRFNYDIAGPAITDPIWGGSEDFSIKDISCTSHWLEFGFGAEVKIYKNFHMGWSVRYKTELGSTKNDYSKASCIPGYGYTTKSSCWGGSYSLIFDLNWGKKKSHRGGVRVEMRDIPANQEKDEHTTEENPQKEEHGTEGKDDGSESKETVTDI